MIYLDNAATTLQKPKEVIDAVVNAMKNMGNSSRGTYECGLDASRQVYEARIKVAEFFNHARADHVIFTNNATESLNIAINGILNYGDHVITTELEHNSVLRPLYRLDKEKNVEISFVAADDLGRVDYADFEKLIKHNTKAIICTHASNLTGNVVDVERIGAIAQKHGLLLIVDASQTAGCCEIDMVKMHIDILCFTGHKGLMGPQGTGGMCIKEGIEIKPWKAGGTGVQTYKKEQPKQMPVLLEAGTLNGHGIAGLSAAIDYISSKGIDLIRKHESDLMHRFINGVSEIEGVKLYGDFTTSERTAIVTLNIRDYDSGLVADELSEVYKIATRSGGHCAPRLHQSLGTREQGAVRFSFSYFTKIEDIDAAINAIREISSET